MKTICSSHSHSCFLAHPACFWHALVAFAGLTLGPQPVRAAVTEAWVQRYNNVVSNSVDQAFKVVSDAAGNIIVTGSTDDGNSQDILTIKYSGADGSVLWQNRYNGPGNSDDQARSVAVDGSGNVVVTGFSQGDFYTAKYAAADGVLLWEKRYSSGQATAVAVDSGGNAVVTGFSGNGTNDDYYTAKYAAADGALLWEKRYSSGQGTAVAVDSGGNVVVTGFSGNGTNDDYYTAKYAATDGALLWEKRYNGPANSEDSARALALDGSGNVVVTGSSVGGGGGYEYYTAKYAAATGVLLWEQRNNGPANNNDFAKAVAVDGSGNVVVTGSGSSRLSPWNYTVKYAAADGALLWEQRHNGSALSPDRAQAVTFDGSGNVVETGVSGIAWLSGSKIDFYTVKYAAADGTLLWEHRFDGLEDEDTYVPVVAMTVDGSGNVVVTGAPIGSGSKADYYTAKYAAANGALLWEKRYNGPANREDSARAVALDSTGNVVVTGSSISSGRVADYYTAKYAAANGALLWEKRHNGSAYGEGAKAVAVDGSGNVVVTGASQGDFYTAKYAAADGALLWENSSRGSTGILGGGNAVALDSSGNVVATGASDGDCYTAKYARANGVLLWEKRYSGPANRDDYASAMAIDDVGNVVVTGTSQGEFYTAKYAGADGGLHWEKRGPSGGAKAMAVDASGNVLVTGFSAGSGGNLGNLDYYTAKYAAGTGLLLWEQRYNDPEDYVDYAQAIAVDSSGNVVVTGSSSRSSGGDSDYYTAKYAAADGALLWEQRYNGSANSHDQANAVAVDGGGNVVVAGSSVGSGGSYHYYTAKYAAADGTLLWDKHYNGPANGNDFVGGSDFWSGSRGLALGPNGMVVVTGSSGGDYATVVYREVLPPIAIALVSTGVRLSFTGTPGLSYKIEHAPAVNGPWTTINTHTALASGFLEYLDALPAPGQAFYRTVQP